MIDFTFSAPAEHAGDLPNTADVVIVGGGIIGVMTAWYLAEAGQKVVLCEKGRVACEQSSRNWGWVRQQGRDLAELPIMMESLSIWKELAAKADLGFCQNGISYVARTQAHMEKFTKWLEAAKPHGVDSKLLNTDEVAAMVPAAADKFLGALHTPSDGCAEPTRAVPILAREAVRKGAIIRERCAVRCLDIAAGKVVGVMTEAGKIAADRVLIAAGAWSSLFLRNHGISIPQLSVKASVSTTTPVDLGGFKGAFDEMQLALRRRDDGGVTLTPSFYHEFMIGPDAFRHFRIYLQMLLADRKATRFRFVSPRGYPDAWGTPRKWREDQISPFEKMRVLNPPPDRAKIDKLAALLRELFPADCGAEIKQAWAGMIDVMPDAVPIVDHLTELPGVTLATGMSGHGFGIGPGFGRVIADMMQGNSPGHDMARFRFSRFTEGPLNFGLEV